MGVTETHHTEIWSGHSSQDKQNGCHRDSPHRDLVRSQLSGQTEWVSQRLTTQRSGPVTALRTNRMGVTETHHTEIWSGHISQDKQNGCHRDSPHRDLVRSHLSGQTEWVSQRLTTQRSGTVTSLRTNRMGVTETHHTEIWSGHISQDKQNGCHRDSPHRDLVRSHLSGQTEWVSQRLTTQRSGPVTFVRTLTAPRAILVRSSTGIQPSRSDMKAGIKKKRCRRRRRNKKKKNKKKRWRRRRKKIQEKKRRRRRKKKKKRWRRRRRSKTQKQEEEEEEEAKEK